MSYHITAETQREAYEQLIDSLGSLTTGAKCDTTFLIIISALAIVFYTLRYLILSKRFPENQLSALRGFTRIVVALCFWNTILVCNSGRIVFDSDALSKFLQRNEIGHNLLASFINIDPTSNLNAFYLRKDVVHLSIILISIALFKVFSDRIHGIIEFISCYRADPANGYTTTDEKNIGIVHNEKRVSFDISQKPSRPCGQKHVAERKSCHSRYRKCIFKHICLFSAILVAWVIILPDTLIFTSTSILVDCSSFRVTFDHIVCLCMSLFLLDACSGFINTAKQSSMTGFPQITSLITHFIWFYSSLILSISVSFVFLAYDVLSNWLVMALNNDHVHSTTPIQVVSLICINYLDFSLEKCSQGSYCDAYANFQQMLKNFYWLRSLLTECWLMFNLSYLVILPFLIWIIIIELKIRQLHPAQHIN